MTLAMIWVSMPNTLAKMPASIMTLTTWTCALTTLMAKMWSEPLSSTWRRFGADLLNPVTKPARRGWKGVLTKRMALIAIWIPTITALYDATLDIRDRADSSTEFRCPLMQHILASDYGNHLKDPYRVDSSHGEMTVYWSYGCSSYSPKRYLRVAQVEKNVTLMTVEFNFRPDSGAQLKNSQ